MTNDDGSTHVLEAVIVASLMISAVAFVVTFETPTIGGQAGRDGLASRANDAMAVLYETPVDSKFGDDALSAYIAECMQGSCSNLTNKLAKTLPDGAAYAMYVSNGYDIYPVYVTREPGGESVTATRLFEPSWSNSFVATTRSHINPETDPLDVYTLPIFNSNTLAKGGSPLRVFVEGTRQADGSSYTLTTFTSTEAGDSTDVGLMPSVSLNFLVPQRSGSTITSWTEGGVGDWTYETIDGSGLPTGTAAPMRLRLAETGDVPVPAGTELTVALPRGWIAAADPAANPGWTVIDAATDRNASSTGSTVRVSLNNTLRNATLDMSFDG